MVETTMDVSGWLRKQLEEASPDLLRAMVRDFAEALMGAEVDALCGAGYGERSDERTNRRNGYRERPWDGFRRAISRRVGCTSSHTNAEERSLSGLSREGVGLREILLIAAASGGPCAGVS